MGKRKLIIVSASSRLKKEPAEPAPAIERYDGVYFRILRKYLREGKLSDADILVISEKCSLMPADNKIPYHEPHPGPWGSLSVKKETISKLKEKNLEKLKKIVDQYCEIYVNVGRGYKKLIEGFENFITCKITYAAGRGLGPKALHMKEWILSQ